MKKIELTVKDLQEMYKNADVSTRKYLEGKFENEQLTEDITIIIGGYADACKYLNREQLELENFKFLPQSQQVNAFYRHKLLTVNEALVGDFVPDFSNYPQYKYYVYAYHDGKNGLRLDEARSYNYSSPGSDFLFPSAKLRDHAMKIMEKEYLQVLTVR